MIRKLIIFFFSEYILSYLLLYEKINRSKKFLIVKNYFSKSGNEQQRFYKLLINLTSLLSYNKILSHTIIYLNVLNSCVYDVSI